MPSANALVSPSASSSDASALLGAMRTDAHAMGLLHTSNQGEIQAGTLAQSRAQNADVKAFAAQMVRDHTELDQQGSALAARLDLSPMLPDSTLPRLQAEEMRTLTSAGGTGSGSASAGGARSGPPVGAGVTFNQGSLGGRGGSVTGSATGTGAGSTGGGAAGTNPPPADSTPPGIPGGTSNAPTTPANQGAVAASAGGSVSGAAASDQGFDVAYMTSQVADHQRTLAIVDAAIAQAQNAELKTALQTQVRPPVAQHLQMAQQLLQKLGGR